jgi:hypothetical protein
MRLFAMFAAICALSQSALADTPDPTAKSDTRN